MGAKWIKISILYFILGLEFGLFMYASLQLRWSVTYTHFNLAGWASIGIICLIYSVYPKAGNSSLGIWSFWLYNIGMPILLICMFIIQIPAARPYSHTLTFTGGG